MRDAVSSAAPLVCATFLGVTLALSLTAVPAQAWAKYTDVSTQYPAAQDLTEVARDGLASIGKSIYPVVVQAGNIVDGTYVVPAYTSSRMCNFYASMADATAKSNPNQVVLNVSGGVVTATFYMSGAYTALYFGTADQAAAGIKAAWAKGAQANDQTSTVMYAVSDGMTSAQLAELLYAKSGAKDTLFRKTQSTIKAQLAAGRNNEQVTDGVESSLKTLATQLAGACQNVAVQAASAAAVTGAESAKATIAQQIEAVQENGYSLVTGSAALSKGTQSLADAVPTLTKGIKALNDATVKIVSGVDKLDDGSHTLADGMVEFDEKGISKIANSYNGDIKPLTDKLQAMLDAGEDYQTFTKVADGVNGSVKFIYKQDAIKADSENNK